MSPSSAIYPENQLAIKIGHGKPKFIRRSFTLAPQSKSHQFRSFIPENIAELLSSYVNIIALHNPEVKPTKNIPKIKQARYTLKIFNQTIHSTQIPKEPYVSKVGTLEILIKSVILEDIQVYSQSTLEDSNYGNNATITCFVGKTNSNTNGVAIIYLVRCINGIPLPEHSYDSCIISKSMRLPQQNVLNNYSYSMLLKSKMSEYGITTPRRTKKLCIKNSARMIHPPGITRHHNYITSIPVKSAPDSTWNIMFLNDNVKVQIIDTVPKVVAAIKAKLETSGKPLELESTIETKVIFTTKQ
ncbi:hypothetical protein BEWA_043980 [Theileria equi strain WA]|uniref:Uncharacterized protein n=1 Tax=Theileria equi strain WA TaxID=1537102 RepID=L1LG00_THEEQ|nr:hypothetical protein BEWA_043980 [Theileria equi strain WA]EKX74357.1 hypothetical protein BEWA_043980 [Theileria equi strain WA]|eukprot:XP_004833809.1 hypothetical protein BEWA_043980 [Theileria equi strain WA]